MRNNLYWEREKFNKPLSNASIVFLMMLIMYSFGTFGLLNLFDIRKVVQIVIIASILFLFIILRPRLKAENIYPTLIFAGAYAVGGFINGGQSTWIIEAVLLIFILYVIGTAKPSQILLLAKAFAISTCLFCTLVLVAYTYYKVNPAELSRANINIYDSTTGDSPVIPGNFIDWVSFTSGDAFVIGGEINTRMKGYSNEPSSTIVHYLAPAILAFAIGGIYKYLGFFIFLVNIIAIGSFTAYIIILLSVAIYFLAMIFGGKIKFLYALISLTLILIIVNPEVMIRSFEYSSGLALDYLDSDIINRKMGGENLEGRNSGMIDGFYKILLSPFGYSSEMLGPGAGLAYVISSFAGWIGLIIFFKFVYKLAKLGSIVFINRRNSISSFSVCLLFSLLLILLFVSGYGWNRPPGVIMMILIYRMMGILSLRSPPL